MAVWHVLSRTAGAAWNSKKFPSSIIFAPHQMGSVPVGSTQQDVVVTFGVEYSDTSKRKCCSCSRKISKKKVEFYRLTRTSKQQKKSHGSKELFHRECFTLPEICKKVPAEMFRGFPALKPEDQCLLRKMFTELPIGHCARMHELETKLLAKEEGSAASNGKAGRTRISKKKK